MSTDDHPARAAAARSRAAVTAKTKDDWLAIFADDGFVEDPVGPSMFDKEGKGHHGREAIAAFWDATIATTESIEFDLTDSFAAGDEAAFVGTIRVRLPGGMRMDTDGVFVYRVNDEGQLLSLRAFWEVDRALATLRPADS